MRDLVDVGSLEHYVDAELYDYEYRRRRADVSFYRQLAARVCGGPGRVLDLGCGSGRATLALARAGHEVVGVDASEAMLARLERRLERTPPSVRRRVRLVRGDLRDFDVGERFPLVISVFNVLEHLYTRTELAACLACVARHLEPGGRFAFDVQMPDMEWLLRDPTRRWARTRFTHPVTGEKLWYSTNHDYDPVSQIVFIRLYYDPVDGGPGRVVTLSQRKFFPAELEALLDASGFALVERYGDFIGSPLSFAAESQVVIAGLKADFLDGNRASGRKSSTGKSRRGGHPRRGSSRSPSSPRRR